MYMYVYIHNCTHPTLVCLSELYTYLVVFKVDFLWHLGCDINLLPSASSSVFPSTFFFAFSISLLFPFPSLCFLYFSFLTSLSPCLYSGCVCSWILPWSTCWAAIRNSCKTLKLPSINYLPPGNCIHCYNYMYMYMYIIIYRCLIICKVRHEFNSHNFKGLCDREKTQTEIIFFCKHVH